MRYPAIKYKNKVYVKGPYHQDAINLMLRGKSYLSVNRLYDRIIEGKDDIFFGFAEEDGSNWVDSDSQKARKYMYGFC